jgi:hypothetical protein
VPLSLGGRNDCVGGRDTGRDAKPLEVSGVPSSATFCLGRSANLMRFFSSVSALARHVREKERMRIGRVDVARVVAVLAVA